MTTTKTTKPKKTTIKIPKGSIMTPTALKVQPGVGAVNFAMQYVGEMTIAHVSEVCKDLVAGYFEEVGDKKVRRCQFCGYYYKCPTKNNSSLVCSEECKTGKDIALKAFRRKVRKAGKPKRPTFKQLYYREYSDGVKLEYPFWGPGLTGYGADFHMFEYDRKHKAYSYGDDLEEVVARALLNQKMGGKKKVPQIVDYEGDRKATSFAVKLSEKLRKTEEIVIYKSSREEIEAGLLERYGAEKLARVRRNTILFYKGYNVKT